MEENEYKDIEYKEKVLFKAKVKLNPHTTDAEVADCNVTEGSLSIESTEPLRIPLDRINSYHDEGGPLSYTGGKVGTLPSSFILEYRNTSGQRQKVEFEMNDWQEAGRLRVELDEAKRMMVRGIHSVTIVLTSVSPAEDLIMVDLPKLKVRELVALQITRFQLGSSK